MSITIYRLPTKEDKLSFSIFHFRFPFLFSISVFHLQQTNGNCHFPLVLFSIYISETTAYITSGSPQVFFAPQLNLSFQRHNCTLCAEAFRHNFYFSCLFIFVFFVFFASCTMCSALWYGKVRYGTVRYATLRYIMIRYSMVLYGRYSY
jgi:hypothetical protein